MRLLMLMRGEQVIVAERPLGKALLRKDVCWLQRRELDVTSLLLSFMLCLDQKNSQHRFGNTGIMKYLNQKNNCSESRILHHIDYMM